MDPRVSPISDHDQPNDPGRDIAVALSHDRDGGDLPRVIASGKGAVARQILQIAFDRGIKVREDADLAEVLAAVDVDSEIPLVAFAAVAEILSYVYLAQGAPDGGATPTAATAMPMPDANPGAGGDKP